MAKQQHLSHESKLLDSIFSVFPDFNVKPENLRCPSKEFVTEFYCNVLLEFGMKTDNIMKVHDSQMTYSHPEMLMDIIPMVNLSKVLERIFQSISLQQEVRFGLCDLLSPTPSRTLVFISSLMNFFHFADQRMVAMHEVVKDLDSRKVYLNELLQKRDQLQKEINQVAYGRTKAHDLQLQIKKNKSELMDTEKENNSLDVMLEKKQGAFEDISKRIARLQDVKLQESETIKMLEQQVVQSPDVLKHDYKHLQEKLPEVEAMRSEALRCRASKTQSMKHLETMIRKQDQCLALSKEVIAEKKILEDYIRELQKLQEHHKCLSGNINEMQAKNHQLVKNCTSLQEELTTIQLKWEKKKSSLLESLRHLKQELSTLIGKTEDDAQEVYKEINEKNGEIGDIAEQYQHLNKKYEELYSALIQREKDIVEKIATEYGENGNSNGS